MNDIYERKKVTTILALSHYIERLKKIEQDPQVAKTGTEPLAKDIQLEIENAERILNHVKEKGFEIESEFVTKIFEDSTMQNTLRTGLLCYYNDMLESLDLVTKSLPTKPARKLLSGEIDFCKKFLNQLHSSYEMDTEIQ